MKAAEIMVRDVVTVVPQTTVKEIAGLMTRHRISGVPVVDGDGKLVGIVSETDLVHRAETGTERRRKWWLAAFMDSDQLAREYASSHGLRAADIMSTGVITVKADADLAEVADLLDRRKLQRVPVMSNGKLVGILTKSDLVRALVARLGAAPAEPAGDAKEILAAIHKRTRRETWLDTSLVNINVEGTVAQISGLAASADQRRALRLLVEDTPGVSRVEDRMTIRPTAPMI